MSRLLVVEDDAAVRTTVVTFLELEGYSVDAVASTSEALERLSENSYPIVISDIYIDDRTGLDVVFAAWSSHPEARPAGNAVELYLEEAADEVWEAFLQAVLQLK